MAPKSPSCFLELMSLFGTQLWASGNGWQRPWMQGKLYLEVYTIKAISDIVYSTTFFDDFRTGSEF